MYCCPIGSIWWRGKRFRVECWLESSAVGVMLLEWSIYNEIVLQLQKGGLGPMEFKVAGSPGMLVSLSTNGFQ